MAKQTAARAASEAFQLGLEEGREAFRAGRAPRSLDECRADKEAKESTEESDED